jgi:hypothetical protein
LNNSSLKGYENLGEGESLIRDIKNNNLEIKTLGSSSTINITENDNVLMFERKIKNYTGIHTPQGNDTLVIDTNLYEIYIIRQIITNNVDLTFNFTNVEEGDTIKILNTGTHLFTFDQLKVNNLPSSFFPNATKKPQINPGDTLYITFVKQAPNFTIFTLIAHIENTI